MPPAPERSTGRTRSIDVLRGSVMLLMVLDHARDFFAGIGHSPTDLATTTFPLFFTRWITHFCAPVFVLLAGVSAQLYARKHGAAQARRFLLTRGLWLVLLELTIVRFAWVPEPFFHFFLLQVIWVLGWAMLVLAGLSYLPVRWVVAIGAVIVVGHNLLDTFDRGSFGRLEPLWNLVHERALLKLGARRVFVSYPLLPWVGVIALGYGLGTWYARPEQQRQRLLRLSGVSAMLGFIALRGLNIYGDPHPWSVQPQSGFTLLSFLNCEKYPPSLLFLLMTLGPALLLLAELERRFACAPEPLVRQPGKAFRDGTNSLAVGLGGRGAAEGEARRSRGGAAAPHDEELVHGPPAEPAFAKQSGTKFRADVLVTLGRVPLFFYVAHLYLLRFTAAPLAFARFGKSAFAPPPGHAGSPELPLWSAYAALIIAILILYPACRWFARKKAESRSPWLSYL